MGTMLYDALRGGSILRLAASMHASRDQPTDHMYVCEPRVDSHGCYNSIGVMIGYDKCAFLFPPPSTRIVRAPHGTDSNSAWHKLQLSQLSGQTS